MQYSLFPNIIREIYLTADSPQKAWWRLMLEECLGHYRLIKKSGIKNKTLDVRRWPMKNYNQAMKIFDQKVKSKTNPDRNSKRIYKVAA